MTEHQDLGFWVFFTGGVQGDGYGKVPNGPAAGNEEVNFLLHGRKVCSSNAPVSQNDMVA